MTTSAGEMPFLEHLEELRGRLIKSIIAVVVGFGVAWWAVVQFNLIGRIKQPIAPYLPNGRLIVLTPTESWMVTLKLGLFLGLALASPVIVYQLWAFLSPALFPREKKAIMPALFIGLLLFLLGAWLGWHIALPSMLHFFHGFQQDQFTWQITWDSYFSLVMQIIFYFGVGFELPLVMIMLAVLGVMSYTKYLKLGRFAIVLCAVGGAFFSPTPDVLSMVIVMVLLLGLYGVGVAGAFVVERRKRLSANVAGLLILVALCATPRELRAQNPPVPPAALPILPGADTTHRLPGGVSRMIDTATARRLGLPSAPTEKFPAPDALMQAILDLDGYNSTRYVADTSLVRAGQQVELRRHAAMQRDKEGTLEANDITYSQQGCRIIASGAPRSFNQGKILIGQEITYNTCEERAVIDNAYTSFSEPSMPGNWFVRGKLAIDSSAKRLYAGHAEFTSCDLPDPHYHFAASELKWVSQSVIVARPVVLYVRDVPVVWLPFIFQDTKNNRHSGILIPQFGINDIVRPTPGYNRQITNLGYYWAPNDYMDVTTRFDWFSNNYIQYGADLRYRSLDHFIQDGSDLAFSEQRYNSGSTSQSIHWSHYQQFNVNTSLKLNFNYSNNTTALQNSSVDPTQVTQSITSSANLSKRFRWGSVTLGGDRSQTLTDGVTTMTLPSATISPQPISLGENSSWSPSLTFTNATQANAPLPAIQTVANGGVDTLHNTGSSRSSTLTVTTPLDLHGFTLNLNGSATDVQITGRTSVTSRVPDLATADSNDSLTVNSVRNGSFHSGVDLSAGISLPILARNTWKITPSVNATNVVDGQPLFLRSDGSNGAWTTQGKKLQLELASAPTFFGFLNAPVGPAVRMRYTFAPTIDVHWSPAASVSPAFAQAVAGEGVTALPVVVPATMTAQIGLQQVIEAKVHPPAHDTTTDQSKWPNRRILQLTTSAVGFDFEQAHLAGRTGWVTSSITNSAQTDLIPGFQLSVTHDLWQGQVGSDTAKFSPFLTNVAANFSISGHMFRSLASLLGLASHDSAGTAAAPPPGGAAGALSASGNVPMYATGIVAVGSGAPLAGHDFQANVTYSLSRTRPFSNLLAPAVTTTLPTDLTGTGLSTDPIPLPPIPALQTIGSQSDIQLQMSFSPTPFWTVSWSTEYDATLHTFSSQNIQLQRDLHDWRANFTFSKAPNGNFALYFTVFLINLPEIKGDYRQSSIQQQ